MQELQKKLLKMENFFKIFQKIFLKNLIYVYPQKRNKKIFKKIKAKKLNILEI
jgi:hypothetical protein